MEDRNGQNDRADSGSGGVEQSVIHFESSVLFGEKKEILIRHKGEIYRIRITRNDKLVMNK